MSDDDRPDHGGKPAVSGARIQRGWSPQIREALARAIHEEYVRRKHGDKHGEADNPSIVPWERLPEHLRESNRKQADHIPAKLDMLGYTTDELGDGDSAPLEVSPAEMEDLAEAEHQRWVAERRQDGWTPGPKNILAKRTPYLVPFADLPEEIKEYDRNIVRSLPSVLAKAGLRIRRRER